MQYKLIFDLQSSDFRLTNYLLMAPGLIILLAGVITFLFRHQLTNPFRPRPMPQKLPLYLFLCGMAWVQLTSLSLFAQYNALSQAMKSGSVAVAEGKVTHFHPASYLGSRSEEFCISETEACFSYNDYILTPGFNQTTSHGGPIANGLPVKVTYKGPTIVKLEVAAFDAAMREQVGKNSPPAEAALSPAR